MARPGGEAYARKHYYENWDRYRSQQRAYYEANKVTIETKAKIYRTGRKAQKAAYDREYRERNRERIAARRSRKHRENPHARSEYLRAYGKRHRASLTIKNRLYRQQNKERLLPMRRAEVLRRRARFRNATIIPFTVEQLTARLSMFGHRCWLCGCENAKSVDHVIALSRGGPHALSNLRPACRSCNSGKGSRDWRRFIKRSEVAA